METNKIIAAKVIRTTTLRQISNIFDSSTLQTLEFSEDPLFLNVLLRDSVNITHFSKFHSLLLRQIESYY